MYSWQKLLESFEEDRDQRIALCGSEEKYKRELSEIKIRAHLESIHKLSQLNRKLTNCEGEVR